MRGSCPAVALWSVGKQIGRDVQILLNRPRCITTPLQLLTSRHIQPSIAVGRDTLVGARRHIFTSPEPSGWLFTAPEIQLNWVSCMDQP
jgi:hypothetical protein